MIYRAEELTPKEAYRILEAVVVPRPIAFITTMSPDGIINATPHSFFNVVNDDPPMVAFSAGSPELGKISTVQNIEITNEFVVNVVTEKILDAVVKAGVEYPRKTSELDVTKLKTAKSQLVHPPRIAESPVSLECRLWRQIPLKKDGNVLTIGEVVLIHVADALLTRGKPDVTKLDAVGRLAGDWFVPTTARIKRSLPT
jgi:flavin reductase (DIM6/NTAB) family NADH-FMN oxidoreductase RutF